MLFSCTGQYVHVKRIPKLKTKEIFFKKIILNEKLDWEVFNSVSSVNYDDLYSRRKYDKLDSCFHAFRKSLLRPLPGGKLVFWV